MIPAKSMMTPGTSKKGVKLNKDRITIMLCCNAVVGKLKPLIIGKAKNPHCFKAIRGGKQKLPIHYEANKTAWMKALILY